MGAIELPAHANGVPARCRTTYLASCARKVLGTKIQRQCDRPSNSVAWLPAGEKNVLLIAGSSDHLHVPLGSMHFRPPSLPAPGIPSRHRRYSFNAPLHLKRLKSPFNTFPLDFLQASLSASREKHDATHAAAPGTKGWRFFADFSPGQFRCFPDLGSCLGQGDAAGAAASPPGPVQRCLDFPKPHLRIMPAGRATPCPPG